MFQRHAIDRGAILFDPEHVDRPGWELFDRERWRAQGALIAHTGGRGSIHFIEDGGRHWALRRYLRGGMAARIAHERFLYCGEDRTRSFLELRLLARLRDMGLPVPAPVAAGYRHSGCAYEAELITERLMGVTTLIETLRAGRMSDARWSAVGGCLRRFHDAGVQHADLTANNILLGDDDRVWVLDFDRGRLREPGAWRGRVLERLARSLAKLRAGSNDWQAGFERLRTAHDG